MGTIKFTIVFLKLIMNNKMQMLCAIKKMNRQFENYMHIDAELMTYIQTNSSMIQTHTNSSEIRMCLLAFKYKSLQTYLVDYHLDNSPFSS